MGSSHYFPAVRGSPAIPSSLRSLHGGLGAAATAWLSLAQLFTLAHPRSSCPSPPLQLNATFHSGSRALCPPALQGWAAALSPPGGCGFPLSSNWAQTSRALWGEPAALGTRRKEKERGESSPQTRAVVPRWTPETHGRAHEMPAHPLGTGRVARPRGVVPSGYKHCKHTTSAQGLYHSHRSVLTALGRKELQKAQVK